MMKVEVIALTTFEHSGKRLKHSKFTVTHDVAVMLKEKGLVTDVLEIPAKKDEPEEQKQQLYAAGQAQHKKTLKKSKSGEMQTKKES